jgi:hypothetical protein
MTAFKFVPYAQPEKPDNDTTQLLEKAQDFDDLTREEKDRIANTLWGIFGSHRASYRLAGWEWPMWDCLHRILVRHTYDNHFSVYYAPDKTSLRKCLNQVAEMVYG